MKPDWFGLPSIAVVPPWMIGLFIAVFCLIGVWFAFFTPKRNWWGGVRTPWTWADEGIWRDANRLLGWALMAAAAAAAIWWPVGVGAIVLGSTAAIPYALWKYVAKYGTAKTWLAENGWRGYRPMAKCASCGQELKLNSPDDLATLTCDKCGVPIAR